MSFKMPGRKRGNLQITISQYHPDDDEKDEKDEGMSDNAARGFAKAGMYAKNAIGKMFKKTPKKVGKGRTSRQRHSSDVYGNYKNDGKYGA